MQLSRHRLKLHHLIVAIIVLIWVTIDRQIEARQAVINNVVKNEDSLQEDSGEEIPGDFFDGDPSAAPETQVANSQPEFDVVDAELGWLSSTRVGYDSGFVIASSRQHQLNANELPFQMKINGWGQLRHTMLESAGSQPDANQFQLKRARLVFAGSAFTPDFFYYLQLDGRSTDGDNFRLLDYYLTYDVGHHLWGFDKGAFGFKTGKYKMPATMSRSLSGRELEFADSSMASTFFDVNRSLAWGIGGNLTSGSVPWKWETAIFNGLVTGGAETGSSGSLDNNFAWSCRVSAWPVGSWGEGELADFTWHETLATRVGAGFASSFIERSGSTEFGSSRVVDSGLQLSTLLPGSISGYGVSIYSVDASCKFHGWSATTEYYFRNISGFEGGSLPDLFDHGFWLQFGKFVVPEKLQLLTRWSRVTGNSGTLGAVNQSSDEIAGGFTWYIRNQNARFTLDASYLNGAPINSPSLDISPGEMGWLVRSQIQFAF